jgi:hypothetical protein
MSKTIWKYPLKIVDTQIVELPSGSTILSIQRQGGDTYLWALVDTNYKYHLVERHIAMHSTGEIMPDNFGTYLATFQVIEYEEVYHVFELGETE